MKTLTKKKSDATRNKEFFKLLDALKFISECKVLCDYLWKNFYRYIKIPKSDMIIKFAEVNIVQYS